MYKVSRSEANKSSTNIQYFSKIRNIELEIAIDFSRIRFVALYNPA